MKKLSSLVITSLIILLAAFTAYLWLSKPVAIVNGKEIKEQNLNTENKYEFLYQKVIRKLINDYRTKQNIGFDIAKLKKEALEKYNSLNKNKLREDRKNAERIMRSLRKVIFKNKDPEDIFGKNLKGKVNKNEWESAIKIVDSQEDYKKYKKKIDKNYPVSQEEFISSYIRQTKGWFIERKFQSHIKTKYEVRDKKKAYRRFLKDQYRKGNFYIFYDDYRSVLEQKFEAEFEINFLKTIYFLYTGYLH